MEDTIQSFTCQQSIANEKHTTIDDEQQLREELIQRATTRLRRRLLEESLLDVMEQIIKLQTHLETIRVDTQTTIGSLTNMLDDKDENLKLNRQMDTLERRLRSHKSDLDQLQSTTTTAVDKNKETTNHGDSNNSNYQEEEEVEDAPQPSASMSRLSSLSLMSSIFGRTQSVSSKATSICSSDENQYQVKQQHHDSELLIEEEKRNRRRRRVRNQRQRYEESLKSRSSYGDDDDCVSQINGSEIYDYKLNYPTIGEDDDDAPFYDLSGKRSFHAGSFCGSVYCKEQKMLPIPQAHDTNIRRKRRHHQYFQQYQPQPQQQQQQQQQQYQEKEREYLLKKYHHRYQDDNDEEEECLFDCHTSEISSIVMSDDTISTLSSFIPDLHHPLSPMTPPPDYSYYNYNENSFGSSNNVNNDNNCYCYNMQNDKNNPSQSWSPAIMYDSWALENLSNNDCRDRLLSLYPQRNVLDDAISFLDGLNENDDDGGLREDMCLLLQNPELCCRPLSEIQGTMDKLRLRENNKNMMHLMKPTTWIQLGVDTTVSAAYKTACTSLQWCRFLSVLSAAVVISLSKGPEDIKRSV